MTGTDLKKTIEKKERKDLKGTIYVIVKAGIRSQLEVSVGRYFCDFSEIFLPKSQVFVIVAKLLNRSTTYGNPPPIKSNYQVLYQFSYSFLLN